jgi:hypothetical protein
MDPLHLTDHQCPAWISEPVRVGEHMAAYSAEVHSTRPLGLRGDLRPAQDCARKVIALMGGAGDGSDGLDEDVLREIEANCSPNLLTYVGVA